MPQRIEALEALSEIRQSDNLRPWKIGSAIEEL
jgi:hypothetical protein